MDRAMGSLKHPNWKGINKFVGYDKASSTRDLESRVHVRVEFCRATESLFQKSSQRG